MYYHKIKLKNGFKRNLKHLLCRIFGHRINENPSHDWCERCSLAYSEAYKPLDWFYMQGFTEDTKPQVKKDECKHPAHAIMYYTGEGRGRDECTLCGTKSNNLPVTF